MPTLQRLGSIGLSAILLAAAACATTGVASDRATAMPSPATSACRIFVLWPASAPAAFRGNVVVHPQEVESLVADRILEDVRTQCPEGELVHTPRSALERGADYLVVPTIEVWNQNRTDDPIGAFVSPKNRIAISLRLVRPGEPAAAGRVRFTNRARVTVNQSAARLLNKDFDRRVRSLLERVPKTGLT